MTQQAKCDFCEEMVDKGKYYYIYCLAIETDKQEHFVGLDTLLEGLAEYLMKNTSHLSASQIVLYRPDILKEYLTQLVKDETKKVIRQYAIVKFMEKINEKKI